MNLKEQRYIPTIKSSVMNQSVFDICNGTNDVFVVMVGQTFARVQGLQGISFPKWSEELR